MMTFEERLKHEIDNETTHKPKAAHGYNRPY